jgi:hypothetical protein
MARQRASDARAAFGRIGVAAVPAPETTPEQEVVTPLVTPTPPVSRGVVTSRRHGNAPPAAGAVALTVRFAPDQAYEVDDLVLALRRRLRRRVDKAEVVRALLETAQEEPEVREFLLRKLRENRP